MLSDTTSVYTDFQGFTEMRRQAREESPDSIKKVAKHFESLFVQMMLKSMRDTLPKDGIFSSKQQRMYEDMFDKQISLQMSTDKGIGLASVIERQISRQQPDVSKSREMDDYFKHALPVQTISATPSSTLTDPVLTTSSAKITGQTSWDQPENFIKDLWPYAQVAADKLGVDADVLIAQSALETGWGQQVRRFDNGQNSYSLFGIKANQHWQGQRNLVSTLEFKDGAMQREQAHFRAYGSVAEAFNDYAEFIQSSPRYQKALEQGSQPDAYIRELQRAGYATDPDYAAKIERIRSSELMKKQVSALKNIEDRPITLNIPESHASSVAGMKRG